MSRKGFRRPLTTIVASVLVLSAIFITRTPVVNAQATTGTIKGVVTDPTGAVVPDADVSAKGVATGIETKTKSNGEGLYMLTVQKQGYKRQEFQQVNVQVGQDTTIDAVLQAGQVTETVTVTASGEELITKEQGQISSTFEARK